MTDLTRKTFAAKIDDVVPGERAVVARITTDAVDRHGEVVIPKGGDLTQYRLNPVVLLAHDSISLPIGKNIWIKPGSKGSSLIAKTLFAKDDDSERVFQCYREGFMNGWSIGFRTKDGCGAPTEDELRARPDWAGARWIYRAWTMLEYSAVPIPANQEALTLAVSKGFILPKWLAVEAPTPEPEPEPAPEPEPQIIKHLPAHRTLAEIERGIAARMRSIDWAALGSKSAQDTLDRLKGRV